MEEPRLLRHLGPVAAWVLVRQQLPRRQQVQEKAVVWPVQHPKVQQLLEWAAELERQRNRFQ
jgi:hypothetical protein